MKSKILLSFAILLFFVTTSNGQQEYMVGTASVSIEPDSTLFSVALSGYGYPAEGRFSLEWIFKGNTPGNIGAITGLDGKFFAADSNNIFWSGTPSGGDILWKKTGVAVGIKALAGMDGKIYAVNDKGELLAGRNIQQNIKWKKITHAVYVSTLTALHGNLYATNSKNELMKMNPLQHDRDWINVGRAKDVKSMASKGERIFAINAADTLWHIQPYKDGIPWTEIGCYNAISYNIHIKQIAVVSNRLYAVSRENKLFIARHTSGGNLSATAFAIKRNNKTVVLVGVDLTGFNYSLTDEVKGIIARERNIPKQAILINASHTHFSPSAQAYLTWHEYLEHPDSLYLNNILKRGLVKVIENAIDQMSPSDLYFGRGTTDIGRNRSAKDPEFPHDKTLDVLQAKNSEGKVTGILFLTGCHPVFNNSGREGYTISANFPGITRDRIRGKMGISALFIQGCAGDINPRSESGHTQTGVQLADDVFKVMSEKMTKITGDISYSFDTINIPLTLTIPAKLDSNDLPMDALNIKPWRADVINQFRIDNAPHFEDLYARRNAKWADLMLNMIKKGTVPGKVPEYINIISVGNWKLVGLSREVVTEYGPAIRSIWPGNIVSVAGYCNDVASYLPNKWHVVNRLYEGYDSFFWYGQPGVPPINVFEIVINGIKSLKR